MSEQIEVYTKHPGATIKIEIDWADALADTPPRQITSSGDSTWLLPTGLTLEYSTLVGAVAALWLSGGVDEAGYACWNRVVINAGQQDEEIEYQKFRVECAT